MNICRFTIPTALLLITTLAYGCAGQVGAPNAILEDVGVQEASELIQRNEGNADFIIVDVRTPEEFSDSHIDGAVNIDFYSETFREDLDKLNKNKIYLVYCRSGNRSRQAMDIMGELGFQEVYNLDAGIQDWIAMGLPITR